MHGWRGEDKFLPPSTQVLKTELMLSGVLAREFTYWVIYQPCANNTVIHTLRKQPECLVGTGLGKHSAVSQLLFPPTYWILKNLVGKCGYLVLSTYCTHPFNKHYIGATNFKFPTKWKEWIKYIKSLLWVIGWGVPWRSCIDTAGKQRTKMLVFFFYY